jgi:hypothetical protein
MLRGLAPTFLILTALMGSHEPGLLTSAAYQQSTVYTCPMHPEVQSSTPGKCPKCGMTMVAQTPRAEQKTVTDGANQSAEAWTCPMHPELRLDAPGKCPKCGMTLVPANPSVLGKYDVKVESTPSAIKPNQKLKLRFSFYEPDTGKQVTQFSPTHTKLFHLFIVSQDMNYFNHIHPVMETDGSFTIETTLPAAGVYKLYSDVYPTDGTPQVLQTGIVTAGYQSDLFASQPHLVPDQVLSRVVDGMKVDVAVDPPEIIAGRSAILKFHLTDAKTGAPVRDLKPYLGAWGHTLILSEDQVDYVHSHPSEMVPEDIDPGTLHSGPDVTFDAFLPRPGTYRIWTQFQRGEKLITVSFTVRCDDLH